MNSAYGRLCGITGGGLIVLGFTLLTVMLVFLGTGQSPIPVDGVGHYFVAFTGSVLMAWGVSLLIASQDMEVARILAPANATGMALMAFYRFVIVLSSADVRAWIGFLPMGEALLFGGLAIAFWWGHPKPVEG
jgi:hypothetical protein